MPSFFDDDSDSDGHVSPNRQARPPPPRTSSSTSGPARAGPGPSSFLSRTLSARHSSPEDDDLVQARPSNGGGDAVMRNAFEEDDDDEPGEDGDDGEEDTPVRRLMRAWVGERAAPNLLRWEGDIVDDLMHKVEQQTEMVTLLLSEASTSEEEHFKLMLVQTEIERIKFLIRTYLARDSQRYNALVAAHYQASVLDSLPASLGSLTETHNDGTTMVPTPKPDTPVFIYCKRDIGPARLPSGQDADFARGTTHLVRWGMVENWVRQGRAELI